MSEQFSVEEKRKWMLKKHIKDHAFEYLLDIVLTMVFAFVILTLCKAENVWLGLVIAFLWSVVSVIKQICSYKREYINLNIKE